MRRPWLLPLRPALPHRGIARTIRRGVVGTAAAFAVAACVAASERPGKAKAEGENQAEAPGFGLLVAGEGAAETYARCIPCHSERLVAQQGLDRQGWEEVIDLMVEEHGMSPIEDPYLDRVLGYLTTHYGPDRPNFPLQ